jgi:hypothetical protein
MNPSLYSTIVGKKKADDSAPEDDRKESQVFGFRAVYVFDLAQTDGEDLPTAPSVQGAVAGRFRRTCRTLRSIAATEKHPR